VGFDMSAADARAEAGHLGIRGLTDLAAASGGRLQVSSTPGQGTRLHLEVPES
jgi:signal transduction histidine kinase